MKKLIILWIFLLAGIPFGFSQEIDKKLTERIDSVLRFTQQSDFERTLDFTYPKLFSIVPRPQMLKILQESLDNEEVSITIDSVKLIKIHPPFTIGNGTYARITHGMILVMKFKEEIDTTDKESLDMMTTMMEEGYGKGNVHFDKRANTIRISAPSTLVAIKNEFSPEWTFVNFDEDEGSQILPLLFSEDVIKKLKSSNN
jgi:hypothetical protein